MQLNISDEKMHFSGNRPGEGIGGQKPDVISVEIPYSHKISVIVFSSGFSIAGMHSIYLSG